MYLKSGELRKFGPWFIWTACYEIPFLLLFHLTSTFRTLTCLKPMCSSIFFKNNVDLHSKQVIKGQNIPFSSNLESKIKRVHFKGCSTISNGLMWWFRKNWHHGTDQLETGDRRKENVSHISTILISNWNYC